MLARFFTAILAKIVDAIDWIGELTFNVFLSLWDLVRDAVCWPFEQILTIIVIALSDIQIGDLADKLMVWDGLPGEVINILGLLGVGQASLIIVTAIGIRLVLQLIPFTRLGS